MTSDSAPTRSHRPAAAAWFALVLLTLWWDWLGGASRWFAAAETALSVLFFVLCLAYLKQFKNKRKP